MALMMGWVAPPDGTCGIMLTGAVAQISVDSVYCLIVLRYLHELLIQIPLQDQ